MVHLGIIQLLNNLKYDINSQKLFYYFIQGEQKVWHELKYLHFVLLYVSAFIRFFIPRRILWFLKKGHIMSNMDSN